MLVALLNRYPFLFFDTLGYFHVGQTLAADAVKIAHHVPAHIDYTGGRAASYGLMIYFTELAGSFWLTAAIQAAIVAWELALAIAVLAPANPVRAYGVLILGLVVASTLPFFTAFIMPDVFAGIALLSLALLVLGYQRLSWPSRIFLSLIGAYAMTTHTTDGLIAALGLATFAVLAAIFARRQPGVWMGIAAGASCLLIALVGTGLYFAATKAALGDRPHSPPFLMARLLADGPGRGYVHAGCPGHPGLEICRYRGQPLDKNDEILWSQDPGRGVVQIADGPSRTRLQSQQVQFALAVLAYDAKGQLRASLHNAAKQLVDFNVSEALRSGRMVWEQIRFDAAMPREIPGATHSRVYGKGFFFLPFELLIKAGLVLSVLFLAFRLTRRDARATWRLNAVTTGDGAIIRALSAATLTLGVVIVGNAVLCGVVSGPYARYEGRIIWLLPALALLALLKLGVTPRKAAA